jgi:hypothetical protein
LHLSLSLSLFRTLGKYINTNIVFSHPKAQIVEHTCKEKPNLHLACPAAPYNYTFTLLDIVTHFAILLKTGAVQILILQNVLSIYYKYLLFWTGTYIYYRPFIAYIVSLIYIPTAATISSFHRIYIITNLHPYCSDYIDVRNGLAFSWKR